MSFTPYAERLKAHSPLLYWRCASATECPDSSGNGNTGTIHEGGGHKLTAVEGALEPLDATKALEFPGFEQAYISRNFEASEALAKLGGSSENKELWIDCVISPNNMGACSLVEKLVEGKLNTGFGLSIFEGSLYFTLGKNSTEFEFLTYPLVQSAFPTYVAATEYTVGQVVTEYKAGGTWTANYVCAKTGNKEKGAPSLGGQYWRELPAAPVEKHFCKPTAVTVASGWTASSGTPLSSVAKIGAEQGYPETPAATPSLNSEALTKKKFTVEFGELPSLTGRRIVGLSFHVFRSSKQLLKIGLEKAGTTFEVPKENENGSVSLPTASLALITNKATLEEYAKAFVETTVTKEVKVQEVYLQVETELLTQDIFIRATYDQTHMRILINGVEVASKAYSTAVYTGKGELLIGKQGALGYNGKIDEVAIGGAIPGGTEAKEIQRVAREDWEAAMESEYAAGAETAALVEKMKAIIGSNGFLIRGNEIRGRKVKEYLAGANGFWAYPSASGEGGGVNNTRITSEVASYRQNQAALCRDPTAASVEFTATSTEWHDQVEGTSEWGGNKGTAAYVNFPNQQILKAEGKPTTFFSCGGAHASWGGEIKIGEGYRVGGASLIAVCADEILGYNGWGIEIIGETAFLKKGTVAETGVKSLQLGLYALGEVRGTCEGKVGSRVLTKVVMSKAQWEQLKKGQKLFLGQKDGLILETESSEGPGLYQIESWNEGEERIELRATAKGGKGEPKEALAAGTAFHIITSASLFLTEKVFKRGERVDYMFTFEQGVGFKVGINGVEVPGYLYGSNFSQEEMELKGAYVGGGVPNELIYTESKLVGIPPAIGAVGGGTYRWGRGFNGLWADIWGSSLTVTMAQYAELYAAKNNIPAAATDTLTLTESASRTMALQRPASDTLTLTEVPARSEGVTRTAEDPLKLTEAPARTLGLVRPASDPLGLSESSSRVMSFTRPASDPLGLAEAPSRVVTYQRPATDVLGLAEVPSWARGVTRTAEDVLVLAEKVTVGHGLRYTASDPLTFTETVSVVVKGPPPQPRYTAASTRPATYTYAAVRR